MFFPSRLPEVISLSGFTEEYQPNDILLYQNPVYMEGKILFFSGWIFFFSAGQIMCNTSKSNKIAWDFLHL